MDCDLPAEDLAGITDDHIGFEREPARKLRAQLGATDFPADDKRPGSANVYDVVSIERLREKLWAKTPVSADIDALEKNDQRH